MRRAPLLVPGLLLSATLFGAGCGAESRTRSNYWVADLGGFAVIESDVRNWGENGMLDWPTYPPPDSLPVFDDFSTEERVTLSIMSEARDPWVIEPGSRWDLFTIDRMEVSYESPQPIEGFAADLNWTGQVGTALAGEITAVPAERKYTSPLLELWGRGGKDEILAVAHFRFYGHEHDSGHTFVLEASLPVHFADWADNPTE